MTLIFITGGVRSGKSAFAEQFVRQLSTTRPYQRFVYVATGVATDEEMCKRIARHQQDRLADCYDWHTLEAPYDIERAFATLQQGDIVLWDCVTTWLTNCFYEGYESGTCCFEQNGCVQQKMANMKAAVLQIMDKKIPLVVVSNELLDEAPTIYEEVEMYRQYLGHLHQWFVMQATEVYEFDYGIFKKWK